MTRWQKDLDGKGWNSNYLNNHDQARQVSRFGNDGPYRVQSAKMLGTFLHLLQGTPYIYQGEEIGMTNVAFESIADYNDIEIKNFYRELVEERGCDPAEIMAHDPCPRAATTPARPCSGALPRRPASPPARPG